METSKNNQILIGWREWIALPELGIPRLKAKIDTGALTSVLHAFEVAAFKRAGKHYVRFGVHPFQRRVDKVVQCEAEVFDIRWISDSGGRRERRYIIKTLLQMAGLSWPIEISLTNRDSLKFRVLLGRTAIRPQPILVDPSASYTKKQSVQP